MQIALSGIRIKNPFHPIRFTSLLTYMILVMLLASCSNRDRNKPDVSNIQVNVSIQRFEQDFFSIDTNQIGQGLQNLYQKNRDFTNLYVRHLLGISNPTGDTAEFILKQVINGYRPVYEAIRKKYPDLNWLKKDLEEAFRYVRHYYPSYKVPPIVSFIGTFDSPGMVYTQQFLGVGLHLFAGKNFQAYQDPQVAELFPSYITRRFDKEYLLPGVMKAVVDDIYPDTTFNAKLIELMIEKGKQWWLLDKFLPDAHDSVKTGYTGKQLSWVEENEGNIWGSILQNTPDLYTVDQERLQNYIGESPRTMDMPETSPGNIGQWVGRQIVRKFEEKNEGLTVQQILATPAIKIFQEAKYRPK